ncbi:hypothetical protein B0H19DRAFT_80398 [Mycena capillaripes]|nr:hypothetical protein B0H19DRAFT_80398 [Mycena capillaripes]
MSVVCSSRAHGQRPHTHVPGRLRRRHPDIRVRIRMSARACRKSDLKCGSDSMIEGPGEPGSTYAFWMESVYVAPPSEYIPSVAPPPRPALTRDPHINVRRIQHPASSIRAALTHLNSSEFHPGPGPVGVARLHLHLPVCDCLWSRVRRSQHIADLSASSPTAVFSRRPGRQSNTYRGRYCRVPGAESSQGAFALATPLFHQSGPWPSSLWVTAMNARSSSGRAPSCTHTQRTQEIGSRAHTSWAGRLRVSPPPPNYRPSRTRRPPLCTHASTQCH